MNVLIVGASSGIGEAIASQLLKEGNKLYLASRTKPKLEGNYNFQSIDVSKEFELDLPDQLEGLVYCPGTINLKPFKRFKEEDFLNDYTINALGAAKVIQQAEKALKQGTNPSIVLFSTVAVQTGLSFHSSISMAKGAVEGLTHSLSAEYAPTIRVNAVAPSLTNTPLASALLSNEDKIKANAERHPLKSIGEATDIANAALFLLSDKARWITGQVIKVDGGMSSIK
jgi:NAD(P)-dependent dehydrogenase (short-subunit alcohol dehydrogenase family)